MIPTVRTDSRKLSPSTQNYDTDSRPLLEPHALAMASTARKRQEDVVFDNSRQPNFCSWLQADIQQPEIDFRLSPNFVGGGEARRIARAENRARAAGRALRRAMNKLQGDR